MIKSCVECPYPSQYRGIECGYDRLIDEHCIHCRAWQEDRNRIPKSYEIKNEADVGNHRD